MPFHLTDFDLRESLREQINFLIASCKAYDSGFQSEAKRQAATLRVLLHDTSRSKSILKHLNKKNIKFYNFANRYNKSNLVTHMGLIEMKVSEGEAKYIPHLDNGRPSLYSQPKLDFNTWWNQTVIVDNEKNKFSRKHLILKVSNQDGGAHIDSSLDDDYAALSRNNSIGWIFISNGQEKEFSTKPELTSIRQITHEVLKTLKDEFPELF